MTVVVLRNPFAAVEPTQASADTHRAPYLSCNRKWLHDSGAENMPCESRNDKTSRRIHTDGVALYRVG